ncbi:hypothetical protein TorRG33x02_293980 [Trema orientale]|uniref:Uncharacterized protein n=1 Tax=Trema orientale TaxID=63057 RepID=A0A2P5C8D1_TREOI|nr:hypothetical protein TorRG33x02_293980 [Trema orientale]
MGGVLGDSSDSHGCRSFGVRSRRWFGLVMARRELDLGEKGVLVLWCFGFEGETEHCRSGFKRLRKVVAGPGCTSTGGLAGSRQRRTGVVRSGAGAGTGCGTVRRCRRWHWTGSRVQAEALTVVLDWVWVAGQRGIQVRKVWAMVRKIWARI